ncbi:MAG TPA: glycosyltransferase family 4 protein [Solirubrobacteraceae bacterium]|jgi:glycosyltransferase involved in cell wall biosynthesis|nr:glycosyltransferase family 4 protein [Solirubrobacteraceae bacterium]
MPPLRLLAYTESSEVGGAEIALGYLLGALRAEIEVGVLATDPDVGAAIATSRPGTRLLSAPAPQDTRDLRCLRAHLRSVRAFAPDILHANQAWPWGCAYGELAGILLGGVRVLAVDHLPLRSSVPRRRLLGRRLLARGLSAHVAVGERCARMVEQIVGIRDGSVTAVANGVPAAAPAPAQASWGGGRVIGSLGRITEQKGYDLLVRALPQLPGATLVLVGDGPQRGSLQELAADLGVGGRLIVTGWKPDARAYLPTFDIFALPSRWEGMPLGILEAMHAGLPVLASDVGSVAEAVREGVTGYVVPAEDHWLLCARLGALLSDAELRQRMGAAGRTLARELYTDIAMARRYEAVYESMLG